MNDVPDDKFVRMRNVDVLARDNLTLRERVRVLEDALKYSRRCVVACGVDTGYIDDALKETPTTPTTKD